MAKFIVLLLALLIVALGGVFYMANQTPDTSVLTGTVRYNERIALPPGSVLVVELREESGNAVSRYEYTTGGENVPLPYTLTYDPGTIDSKKQYVLFAELSVDGEPRFYTETPYPVLSEESPSSGTDILLVTKQAGNENPSVTPTDPITGEPTGEGKKPPSPSPLNGTAWVWRETTDGDKKVTPDGDDFVLTFTEDAVRSTTDCNSLGGTYIIADSNITFSPFYMTEMYCEGSQEGVYATALSKALQFEVEGTALMFDIGDGNQMRFMKTTPPAAAPEPASNPDEPVSSDATISADAEISADAPELE